MSIRGSVLCGVVIASLVPACASEQAGDEFDGETSADGEDGKGDSAAAFTFYEVYADLRQCSFDAPGDCGVGYFVKRANRSTTPCGRGLLQETCKVTQLDWTGTGMPESVAQGYQSQLDFGKTMILRGNVVPAPDDSYMALAATEVWTSPVNHEADGVFAFVEDNGIKCIAAPCPSLTEHKLNSNLSAMISELDFSGAEGVSQAQITNAQEQLYGGSGLIVVGARYYDDAGGKARTADKWYSRAPIPLH